MRSFWSLIVTQFQGAFSDNALKTLVTFIGLAMVLPRHEHEALLPLVGVLFSLPFILFSMAGGYLADRYSKRTVTVGVKLFEIIVMIFALVGFARQSLPMGLAAVFLMGTHSAFFGPSKYGLLPELLPEKLLSWGNGILELGTFVAIISGVAAGAYLFETFKGRHAVAGVLLIGLAAIGLVTSLGIARVPAADPHRKFRANFAADLFAQIALIRRDRVLWLAVLGNIYFAFLGVLVQQNVILFGTDTLHMGELKTSYLIAALAIGIGVGSYAAGHLSGGKIEYGLIPLGSVGMTIFCAALYRPGLSVPGVAACLLLLGFFGGFFIVPISAIMQHRPDKSLRGSVLAAGNLLSFVGVFLASGVYYLLTSVMGIDPRGIFLISAALTTAGTIYVLWILPESFVRLVLFALTHSIYRIRVAGRDNIPEKGGALFVCNHVSFVDALLLIASTDRPLRAIMFKGIYDHPVVKPFARIMRAIPITSQFRPREMVLALREASSAIKAGEVVVIFAEGQITRIGQMLPFRRGFERIMKDVEAPIIPVCLDGVWGSIFSYEKGRFLWKFPRYIPYPVTVSFGRPLPSAATPFEVREAVQELTSDAWAARRPRMRTLDRAFVATARRHPFRFAMADALTPKLRFGAALGRTIFLARRLAPVWSDQEMVGILLPPSIGGALVNHAAHLLGKVPVNLNYTTSSEVLASCAGQCGIRTIITSKAFLEKVKLTVPGTPVFLEELAATPRAGEKLASAIMAWTLPYRLLTRALGGPLGRSMDRPLEEPIGYQPVDSLEGSPGGALGGQGGHLEAGALGGPAGGLPMPPTGKRSRPGLDDLATVIFSSGSTGDPKGVMLTHHNIASNIAQLEQVFALGGRDRILGILPFFHSFGFTGTLMAPAVLGVGVVYHPSPLDARAIGALVGRHSVTFMLATPTFLQLYLRSCEPEDFGSLAFVLAGAEKLPERLAQAFEDRFGIRPLEGYGTTECAPVIAVNRRDYRAAGFRQVGAKRGKIGHPLPGVSVRIVDPETGAPLGVGAPGLLLVRGPNVMKGYLGRPELTAQVLKDGWYVTGDVAAQDEDGFLTITDRLSRFSKIGGEMVPHIRIEEALHDLAGLTEQSFAVTGVPDEKKGERLVVLHTLDEADVQECLAKLSKADLPNLWKPRSDQFFKVEALPYLGTGKLDLRNIREMAFTFASGKS